MTLDNYISDLLYRHDCVIVPDFGGFISNKKSARLDAETHAFYPPYKQIGFNSHLKHNDGLLANYIATKENISYQKATSAISLAVIKWQNKLQSEGVEIKKIGKLSLNAEKQIEFTPGQGYNYLTSSFGLSSVKGSPVARETKVIPIAKEKKSYGKIASYAAAAAIVLSLGFIGLQEYNTNQHNRLVASQQKAVEKKIQTATFVIDNPLPTLELQVSKAKLKPYHVIAGAFQFPENAKKKLRQLKAKGYDASIIGKNKWGLTQVAFGSYENRNQAINNLYRIQDTVSEDAWLLVKK
jgi:hypothetical protein